MPSTRFRIAWLPAGRSAHVWRHAGHPSKEEWLLSTLLHAVLDMVSVAFSQHLQGKLRGQEVAVKVLQKQKLDSDTLEAFRKEVAIMSKLRQPHLLLFM